MGANIKMKTIPSFLFAIAALGAVSSVGAISFDFYKLDKPNGAGDFLPIDGFFNADDMVGSPTLTYVNEGLSVTASATYNGNAAVAVQDSTAGWSDLRGAGLGVYKTTKPIKTSDDNIDRGETLILTFDQVVTLSKVELRADKHGVQNWVDGATFLLNGMSYALPKGVGSVFLDLTGSVFSFTHSAGISDPTGGPSEDFYVAGLNASVYVAPPPPATVPDSASTLSMLGLGLIVLSGVARRFKR
ncbi:hypothetical protein [Pelagicoccus sp. SDUM812002]|uniref:hypothetical protein n=1 Tax=Pelagicoccus sp. SDUM812002 TaxID=3041266 RepID=UPI00280DAB58|nr:hypothetical protein [Pelagicoccus sp. SDUM812002]MDQ8187386.1 hypothetical protein [Pelagicoccus sp. SDUM812002]